MDGRHPGPDRVALDPRDVPDLDPWHVGDGVPPAGTAAERDPERAGPRLTAGRGPVWVWCAHGDQRNDQWRVASDVRSGRDPPRHDGPCGPQTAGQRGTRTHHRVSAVPPAGGPGLADTATKIAQLGTGASHRVSAVPAPRGPGLEAAGGARREAADRAGVHLLRAPVRLYAAAGHPGQPLRAVRSPGAAA